MPRPFLCPRFVPGPPPALGPAPARPLCRCHRSPRALGPTSPHRAQPPPASAARSSRPPSGYLGYETSRNHRQRGCHLPRPSPSGPRRAPAAGGEHPFSGSLAPPKDSAAARLPVTPLPPASYRHRLPQPPANCSATSSPPTGRVHVEQQPHVLAAGGPRPAPRCSV